MREQTVAGGEVDDAPAATQAPHPASRFPCLVQLFARKTTRVTDSAAQTIEKGFAWEAIEIAIRQAAARRMGEAHRLLLVQIVYFQKFGPEFLWRRGNVWPALRRKVHQIPVRPHRVEVIRHRLSSPDLVAIPRFQGLVCRTNLLL